MSSRLSPFFGLLFQKINIWYSMSLRPLFQKRITNSEMNWAHRYDLVSLSVFLSKMETSKMHVFAFFFLKSQSQNVMIWGWRHNLFVLARSAFRACLFPTSYVTTSRFKNQLQELFYYELSTPMSLAISFLVCCSSSTFSKFEKRKIYGWRRL